MKVNEVLDINMQHMDIVFADCGDFIKRKFPIGADRGVWMCVAYIDMMVDRVTVDGTVLQSLMLRVRNVPPTLAEIKTDVFSAIRDGGVPTAEVEEKDDFDDINTAILTGDTVLFVEGFAKALVLSTKGWPNRGVQSAETEVVVQGSKEAFNEGFRVSSALIRRRIRDTRLKLKQTRVGRRSKTDVGFMYLDDVVRPDILEEVVRRVEDIDIDAITDSGCVEQLIEEDWLSPFPQAQVTERPDKAASAILEGRVVIIVDNSPFVLIVPVTLNSLYQASEDYYQRWFIMSLLRVLRFIAGFLALTAPALYLSAAVYHPSMLPTLLTYKMAGARQMVPFPALVEILLMDFAFELLREAGIRLPGPIGSAIGIVGGVIIGQAAVEAGLVSPIVVIVVALTGICGFTIPNVSLVSGYRISKYLLIFLAGTLGLFGFWLGLLSVLIHIVSLKSFGIPYIFPFAAGGMNDYGDWKDSIIRAPLFLMRRRPIYADPSQTRRMATRP